jgi:hypothetical protein
MNEETTKKDVAKVETETGVTSAEFKENVDTMLADRKYLKEQLESVLVAGADYNIILRKKCLGKGGAEKLATIFKLTATFEVDKDVMELMKGVEGLIAYKCILKDAKGNFRGQGGGADTLARNASDPNKTMKMAQKRAFVDAVIRTTGLSDIFTQDLDDMTPAELQKATTPRTYPASGAKTQYAVPKASDKQIWLIEKELGRIGVDHEWFKKQTGHDLESINVKQASVAIAKLLETAPMGGVREAEIEYPDEVEDKY